MTDAGSSDALMVDVDGDGVIVVEGDVDMAGGPILEQVMADREDGATPLVIDVGGVSFMDSSGLRALLGASRRAKGRGGSVVLRNVGTEVARLLDITGTTSQFTIASSRD
jgi:anti-sigma B factor antagonist